MCPSIGIGIRINKSFQPYWTPRELTDGNTVAWYDSQDLSTITKDAGTGEVSLWKDKLLSGHDLICNDATAKPIWSLDGILFDGINDYLRTVSFVFEQPEFIYILLKQKTFIQNSYILDGNDGDSGGLYQNWASPMIRLIAGTFSQPSSDLLMNTWGIVRILFNHDVVGGSKLQVNENVATVGDFGVNNMNGFVIGGHWNAGNWANIEVKEIILRKSADNPEIEQIIYDYLKKK